MSSRLLFMTTFNVSIEREHYFTINVWNELSKSPYASLASVLFSKDITDSTLKTESRNDRNYYQLIISQDHFYDKDYIIASIVNLFEYVQPTIIHSNMIEGYEILAAKKMNIPVVLTIHIGGFICPRGGGNGFLMYDDSICDCPIGNICMRCGCMDLPLPYLSYALLKLLPKYLIESLSATLRDKNIFYITPFLNKYSTVQNRKQYIHLLSYTHIIAANYRLRHLLEINGIPPKKIHIIPHGVKERNALPLPIFNDKVKFYYLGRIQYSKGLHILIKAFDGIDPNKYELHIIGDSEGRRKEQSYEKRIRHLAHNKNVIFHGRLPNDKIEGIIKNCHVMIHSTICLEIYGISISESLSLGRPVLATRCGGAEMQIKDGYNGWLCEPNSILDMRHKILYIINNYDEVCLCARNARLPHSLTTYSLELESLYSQIEK